MARYGNTTVVTDSGGAESADSIEAAFVSAHAAARSGDHEAALRGYTATLHMLGDAADPRRADLLRHIGTAYREAGDTERAAQYYGESLDVAAALGYRGGMAHAVNWLAVIEVRRGDLDEANADFLRAKALATEAGDQRLLGMIEQNLGVVANIRGDLDTAIARYRAALAGFRVAGDAEMIASVLNNVGLLATELKHWREAEESFREAIRVASDAGLQALVNSVQLNTAALAAKRSQWTVVEQVSRNAIDHARRGRSRWHEAEALRLSGMAARERGDLKTAEKELLKAGLLATESEDRLLEAEVARETGKLFGIAGRHADARASLAHALDLFGRIGAALDIEDVQQLLRQLDTDRRH